MDRSTKTFLAVFLTMGALLVAVERAVRGAPLGDWWLPGALLLGGIVSGLAAREREVRQTPVPAADVPKLREWTIVTPTPPAEALSAPPAAKRVAARAKPALPFDEAVAPPAVDDGEPIATGEFSRVPARETAESEAYIESMVAGEAAVASTQAPQEDYLESVVGAVAEDDSAAKAILEAELAGKPIPNDVTIEEPAAPPQPVPTPTVKTEPRVIEEFEKPQHPIPARVKEGAGQTPASADADQSVTAEGAAVQHQPATISGVEATDNANQALREPKVDQQPEATTEAMQQQSVPPTPETITPAEKQAQAELGEAQAAPQTIEGRIDENANRAAPAASAPAAAQPTTAVSHLREGDPQQDMDIPGEPLEQTVERIVGVADATSADNLTVIEGIGPKYSEALRAAGITSFAQLAETTTESLTTIIKNAGMRRPASVPTWAEQAAFAARQDWEGLAQLQASLTGGRKA